MASGGGISGVAVAVATAGAVLVYAGYRGINPLQALKDVTAGKPPGVPSSSAGLDDGPWRGDSIGEAAGDLIGDAARAVGGAQLVAAARSYKSDRYSQSMRHSPGYSDCSSFVAKALKKIGVKPPNPDTTQGFVKSADWQRIPMSDAAAGDIVVTNSLIPGTGHMIIVTGPGKGIGQQNSRSNVREGTIKDLMTPHRSYIAMRYVGRKG